MEDEFRAELPEDLADELVGMGFEEFFVFRGFLVETGTVMTVASASVAAGANMATIVVARKELGDFVAAVRDWVRRKAADKPDGEVTIDVSARRGDEETRMRVKIESKNGMPELDTVALTAFITSLLPGKATDDAASASS
jgi:hypothetical protein